MKLITTILLCLFLSSCAGQTPETESAWNYDSLQITREQAELIHRHTENFPNDTQLSMAIIENGEVSFVGVQRTPDGLTLVDNHQGIFEIGSISKVFTATLLANLELEGQLERTDPIQQHLDFALNDGKGISLLNLANHTAGFPRLPSNLNLFTTDPNNPYKQYNDQDLKVYLSERIEPMREAGTQYEYSNLGAGTLGFVLTQITQSTYEELLQEKICAKYRMANSTTKRERVQDLVVSGLNASGKPTSNWDFQVLVGAGGILSSTEDLAKFALAQFSEEHADLALTQTPTFTVNDDLKIGLGWHLLKSESGQELLWHNGGTGGYTSSMVLDTAHKNGVIILSNVSAFNQAMGNIDKLSMGLIETLGMK